jgi:LysR family transcriptional activator of nhaA
VDWLNYHHFFYFWCVARNGSIKEACKELGLTPQTVSAQIQNLEESLQESLFIRQGRGLVLTEVGHLAFSYANDIFSIGREFVDVIRQRPTERPLKLRVGITDVLPKSVVHHLLQPALELETSIRLLCLEGKTEKLLASLAVHELDLVLTDTPIPPTVNVRAFSHLLGECGVSFVGTTALAEKYRDNFPDSLNGAPILLPTDDTTLRLLIDQWFAAKKVFPRVVGEFADGALLEVFGRFGSGVFAIPSITEPEVERTYNVSRIGKADGVVERFYAISEKRRIVHPAVLAIRNAAKSALFT